MMLYYRDDAVLPVVCANGSHIQCSATTNVSVYVLFKVYQRLLS